MTKKFKKGSSLLLGLLLIFSVFFTSSVRAESPCIPAFANGLSADTRVCPSRLSQTDYVSKNLLDDLKVYPGGIPFGIKFITDGIMIIGFCDVKTDKETVNPASAAGLRLRDTIISVNGKKINDASELTKIVESSGGKPLSVEYTRDGESKSTSLTPAFSAAEGKFKTGMYVRDNGAGIGTVTFIMPDTLCFGGLGHGICDGETGGLIPIQRGSVVNVTINGVVKGLVGSPGEIKGYFTSGKIGSLLTNTECGVYGAFVSLPPNVNTEAIPIGRANELKEGDAFIYCTLSDNTLGKYSVRIENIQRGETGNKCFNVKITDPTLLEKTGGIVQGMSGRPIIQNGKLVGAVTHVLINDPSTGYGIFIENMLNAAQIPEAKAS